MSVRTSGLCFCFSALVKAIFVSPKSTIAAVGFSLSPSRPDEHTPYTWPCEICPSGFVPLLLCSHFVQFEANLCDEATCGLVRNSHFYRDFGCFGGLGTLNSASVLFDPPKNRPCYTPKTRYVSGNMSSSVI